jgi:hypothetical protein
VKRREGERRSEWLDSVEERLSMKEGSRRRNGVAVTKDRKGGDGSLN